MEEPNRLFRVLTLACERLPTASMVGRDDCERCPKMPTLQAIAGRRKRHLSHRSDARVHRATRLCEVKLQGDIVVMKNRLRLSALLAVLGYASMAASAGESSGP